MHKRETIESWGLEPPFEFGTSREPLALPAWLENNVHMEFVMIDVPIGIIRLFCTVIVAQLTRAYEGLPKKCRQASTRREAKIQTP